MIKALMFTSLLFLSSYVFSQPLDDSIPNHSLIFQIIQDEFILDNTTVKNAAIIEVQGKYQGLNVELKPQPAAIFSEMTKAGRGRKLNLIFNKVLISTTVLQAELVGNFLISGISKQDAQTFLNVLNTSKPRKMDETVGGLRD